MFTGIIRKISSVAKVNKKNGSLFLFIKIPRGWIIKKGESISVNGICSTVRAVGKYIFEVEYMPETIKKTTAGSFKKGTIVNLEKSLRANDLLDGHLVMGHIDTVGTAKEIKKVKQSVVLKIGLPINFMKFIAEKGSVAIDGISLTVVETGKNWFTVSLVSYTLENTNLGILEKGDKVNVEIDILAKYINKLISTIGDEKKN